MQFVQAQTYGLNAENKLIFMVGNAHTWGQTKQQGSIVPAHSYILNIRRW